MWGIEFCCCPDAYYNAYLDPKSASFANPFTTCHPYSNILPHLHIHRRAFRNTPPHPHVDANINARTAVDHAGTR